MTPLRSCFLLSSMAVACGIALLVTTPPAQAQIRAGAELEASRYAGYRDNRAAAPESCYLPSAQSLELDAMAKQNLHRLRLKAIGEHALPETIGGSAPASPNWFTWQYFQLDFENEWNSEPQDLAPIEGADALWLACHYYSISTLDFAPTLPKLISAGFWPFDNFEEDRAVGGPLVNLTDRVHSRELLPVQYVSESDINSAQWIYMARDSILRAYYSDFFSSGPVKSSAPRRSAAELGRKCPAFWTNPFSGQPMQDSDKAGDFRLLTPAELVNDGWLGSFDRTNRLPDEPLAFLMTGHGIGDGAEAATVCQPAFGGLSDLDRLAQINLMAARTRTNGKPFSGPGFVRFDSDGPRLDVEHSPAGRALELAAAAYATATLDFSVTPQELKAAGFWPYDTMPADWQQDNLIYDVRGGILPNWLRYSLYRDSQDLPFLPNSQEWLLWTRAQILNAFNEQYFYAPTLQTRFPREGAPSFEQIAPRCAAFWVNPLSDQAFSAGSAKGELSQWPVSTLKPLFEGADLDYDLQVPHINLCQKLAAGPDGLPVPLQQWRHVDISGTPQTVSFSLDLQGQPHTGRVSFVFDQPATRTDQVPVDDGWTRLSQGVWPWAPSGYLERYGSAANGSDVDWGVGFASKGPRILFDELAPIYARAASNHDRGAYSEFMMNLEAGQLRVSNYIPPATGEGRRSELAAVKAADTEADSALIDQ